MDQWKIGCSGYHYGDWKRIFYPDGLSQRKWFEYYAQHFDSLELNVTFYRFPKIEFLQSWYDRSPDKFTFSVKVPRLITHYKKMNDAQHLLADFYNTVQQGLGEKLGCVLFQFPSSFVFDEHRLEGIINLLKNPVKNVVEFRHESWWKAEIYKTFAENNITFCGMSHPNLPDQVIKTTKTIYYRFHGVPRLYWSEYEDQKLEQVIAEVQQYEGVQEAYIYFNNTAEGTAIIDAKKFQKYCTSVSQEPQNIR
jgi:uncharacterized protein YecE (DUF72 family)